MKAVIRTFGLCVLVAVGCGDLETTDTRGYTKAPLEHPTILIRGEQPSEMAMLREPLRPELYEVPMPDTTPAEAPATPAGPSAPVDLPEGVTPDMVAAGEQIYGGNGICFTCHGATGDGTPLAPALNDGDWINVDGSFESIQDLIRTGVPQPVQYPAPMPAMGGAQLTEEQVRDVAAYVYSISH